ncbi:MAG: 3-deoxy-D-manno-octulosonic acid transferase [Bacteroidales bacterium]|nr:3-deoxy-D-manno-octulosonic acid transferase [Bacteroidales bacterium]
MKYLYSAGIYLYNFLIIIASVFNKKAAAMLRGRRGTFGKITQSFDSDDRVFWFHCASLGEFEQGRPVIEKLKEEEPEIKILITFYSPSGYKVRHNYTKADCVVYLPADTLHNAYRMVTLVNPEKVIFVKYEFWYNYLRVLQRKNIPVYLISGIFRPSQPFFRYYGKYFLRVLRGFARLFIQDSASGELLAAHNIYNYKVSGDTRFDRVMAIRKSAVEISGITEFKAGSRLIVAGSTWPPEEEIIAEYLNKESHDVKFMIAPHNVSDVNIDRIEHLLNVPYKRYSKLEGAVSPEIKVLIIDSIGLLSSVYRYADIAVIGGGFGKGIHNILEAATWGVPVVFGPRYHKFREAVDLIELGGAKVFNSYDSFVTVLYELISESELLSEAGRINITYINENLGATGMITTELLT